MEKRKELSVAVLELLSNILGDTTEGLTGTEIHSFLLQAGISALPILSVDERHGY